MRIYTGPPLHTHIMLWTETIAPASRVIDYSTAATHCQLDDPQDREYVLSLIDAATDELCHRLQTSLVSRTLTARFYDGEPIHLPMGPVQAITSVTDDDGDTITDNDLERVGNSDRLKINVPFAYPLTVVYTAGYATVPPRFKTILLAHVRSLYDYRDSLTEKPLTVPPHVESFYRLNTRRAGVR